MLADFDYPKLIGELNLRQKVKFYQIFARKLNLGVRYINSVKIPDAEKLHKIYALNEILHRVLAKLVRLYNAQNVNDDHWSEADFAQMVKSYAMHHSVEGLVEDSIKEAYKDCLLEN